MLVWLAAGLAGAVLNVIYLKRKHAHPRFNNVLWAHIIMFTFGGFISLGLAVILWCSEIGKGAVE